ncbi:MAG: FAD-dependent oxidoreductase [Desulfuromonadales bacterium]|nr:FAD-dependent oxidoreductase [Desulfuromonadales bacterium]
MAGQFDYLFTPLKIKNVTIRNRVLMTAHGTLMGACGYPTEQLINYYVEKAKGGCGLLISEFASIHPGYTNVLRFDDEKLIPAYKAMTAAVHEHGAAIIQQVGHIGRQRLPGQRLTWAPSAMPLPFFDLIGLTPKEIEIEEIQQVVEMWGKTARNVKESGFDGVEIHSLYGNYLLGGFLSPYSNKRTDEYGGSFENRMRIIMEVIDSVRAAVGDDYVVGIQVNGDDLTPGGLDFEEWKEVARIISETGKIDYITVKAGTYWTPNMVVPDMQHPLGLWVPFASGIKEVAANNTLVFAVGRINDPVFGEKILADGHADMVGMTRAQVADPELANKAQEGRLEDIRPCIACNDGCWGMIYGGHFSCTHNPAVAREKELGIGTLKKTDRPKSVLVVGGGPAGLKAAEIAARRGHRVALYEAKGHLGGQVKIAAKGAGRAELEEITRYLARQVEKLGVEVHLNTEVTPEMILQSKADAVVLATGSTPRRISFTGIPPYDIENPVPNGFEQGNVLTSWDLLETGMEVGQKVLVVDDGEANWKGISIAELLLDQGKQVEMISPHDHLGHDLTAERRLPMLRRILKKGIVFHPYTMIKEIDGTAVALYNIHSRQERTLENVDHVVLAHYHKANEELYFGVKGKVKELHRIGDCLAPRMIGDAIRDGERIGRQL